MTDQELGVPIQQLSPGDRIQLSDLGKERSPKLRDLKGTVVSIASKRLSRDCILIRFDGRSTTYRLHKRYLIKSDFI